MTGLHEQKCCIKFHHKLGNNQIETIQKMQQACGDEAISQTQIKETLQKRSSVEVSRHDLVGRPQAETGR